MKEYLFTYGTLRKGFDLRLKHRVEDGMEYVGQGKVGASMYDIGRYPGAIRSSSGTEVVGDVFLVNDPARVFQVLDRYEGFDGTRASEFVRKRNRVRLRSGRNLNAWVYWYNFDLGGKVRIRHKNYLNYLKSKKTA